MTIQLNGEAFETTGPLSVGRLLAQLAIDPRRVAVEHNRLVVKKAAYNSTVVAAGDEVEVVNFGRRRLEARAPQEPGGQRRPADNRIQHA